jgi:hypothetical protein
LVDHHFVNLTAGETALALLCISYLGFEGFDLSNDDIDLSDYVPSGYYGFMDYAYAYWSRHLDACLRLQQCKDTIADLSEVAEVFIDLHWTQPQTKTVIPKSFLARWELLKDNRNFDKLVLAGYVAHRQLIASTAHAPNMQVLRLHSNLTEIRDCLEVMGSPVNTTEKLRSMYGKEIFKCPRVNCVRFYSGFGSKQQRDDHVPKHERSFFCSVPACAMALLGCVTLKELQKHETEYHGMIDLDDDEGGYPEPLPEKVSFDCRQCGAKFTRNNNLKIHMRSHYAPNEKKHVCPTCGKSFNRNGERTRHIATTHSNAKSFVCGGVLKDASSWGCGHYFTRGDMLKRHWKSAKGKACMLRKQQEEEAEVANLSSSVQPSNASTLHPRTELG